MKQVEEFNLLPEIEDYTHGFTINFTVPDLLEYGGWIGKRIKEWDMANIGNLITLLMEAKDVLHYLDILGVGFTMEEIGIDMANIPSYPVPPSLSRYTIWAIDSHGRALVGEDMKVVSVGDLMA